MIILVDGGPDQKVIETAIHHFIERSLDAIIQSSRTSNDSSFKTTVRTHSST